MIANLNKARNIIRHNPGLIWYTKSYDQLDIRSVAEAVLNYGTWDEFKNLSKIIGVNALARVFASLDSMPRNNLLPKVRSYFKLYFKHHAYT
ncbi:hypothetical protein KKE75_00155 [Patescibacteria group bacterium]|nr:hypothetical protein [Patescibacteria group bacterium]